MNNWSFFNLYTYQLKGWKDYQWIELQGLLLNYSSYHTSSCFLFSGSFMFVLDKLLSRLVLACFDEKCSKIKLVSDLQGCFAFFIHNIICLASLFIKFAPPNRLSLEILCFLKQSPTTFHQKLQFVLVILFYFIVSWKLIWSFWTLLCVSQITSHNWFSMCMACAQCEWDRLTARQLVITLWMW